LIKLLNIFFVAACGGEIDVGEGEITLTTPHYPHIYEEIDCKWLLKAEPGKQIHLKFVDFSI